MHELRKDVGFVFGGYFCRHGSQVSPVEGEALKRVFEVPQRRDAVSCLWAGAAVRCRPQATLFEVMDPGGRLGTDSRRSTRNDKFRFRPGRSRFSRHDTGSSLLIPFARIYRETVGFRRHIVPPDMRVRGGVRDPAGLNGFNFREGIISVILFLVSNIGCFARVVKRCV